MRTNGYPLMLSKSVLTWSCDLQDPSLLYGEYVMPCPVDALPALEDEEVLAGAAEEAGDEAVE